LRLGESIRLMRLATSFGSLAASFFRFVAAEMINETHRVCQPSRPAFPLMPRRPSLLTINGDVAERGRAVVLNIRVGAREKVDQNGDRTGVDELLTVLICRHARQLPCVFQESYSTLLYSPECVMLSRAPVAFLCTLMSFDRARRVRGTRAPDLAILFLFSSARRGEGENQRLVPPQFGDAPWVARLVMQPTALHCTSTLGESICRMSGSSPPSLTIVTLFSAVERGDQLTKTIHKAKRERTVDAQVS
jgi:hypothetical protein